jgi:hypothetical protein
MGLCSACSSTDTTDMDGGAGSASLGTGGSATGSGGSTGSGGTSDGGGQEAAALSACEKCASQQCGGELLACRANTDCASQVDTFFTCLAAATTPDAMLSCETDFATQTPSSGQEAANNLGTCMRDSDAGVDCEEACLRDGG